MNAFEKRFIKILIPILVIIFIILSLLPASSPDGPKAVKVSYPYNFDVETLDFSPDGKLLAAGYEEGYVRVWNIENGEDIYDPEQVMEKERLIRTFGSHDITHVTSVDFSSDGEYVLSGGYLSKHEIYDNKFNERNETEQIDVSEIKLWSANYGNCIRTHYLENNDVESVAFSPDGKSYAASYQNDRSAGNTTICIWSTETGEVLNSVTSPDYTVQSLKFSPDGNYLVVSYSGNPRIVFWDLGNMSAARAISTHFIIRDLDFSDDGRIFAGISDYNGRIFIWDAATGDVLRTFNTFGLFANMDLSPDGEYVASIRDRSMTIWNVSSGREVLDISSLPEVGDRIDFTCLQFSPDMEYLAAGVHESPTVHSLSLDDHMKAYKSNVSDDVLSELDGSTPIFLWDFRDIEERGYIESFWDVQRELTLFWLVVLWAPLIAVSYFCLFGIYYIMKKRMAK